MTDRRLTLFLISILLVSGLFVVVAPQVSPSVHAPLVGTVCIAKDGSTGCPGTRPLLTSSGPSPCCPQFRVAVVVTNSDSVAGFDIILTIDHNILKPIDASLTGTLLPGSPAIVVKCIGGVGSHCQPMDNADSLHFAASALSATSPPTSGLLFTAIYNVTGNTVSSPLVFARGCGTTSVSGGVCVSLSSGGTSLQPENFQEAKYSNQPYFDMAVFDINTFGPAKPLLVVPKGSSDTTLGINVTGVNGFAGSVSLTVNTNPSGITATVSPSTLTLAPPSFSNSATLNVTVPKNANIGTYNVTVTGSGGVPAVQNSVLVKVSVPAPDFTIQSNAPQGILTFNVTESRNATITLTSKYNFNGTVALSLATSPGVTATLAKTSLNVTKASSISTTILVSDKAGAEALVVNVTGTSGLLVHTATLTLVVLDFALNVGKANVPLAEGTSTTVGLTVQPLLLLPHPYNVTVKLGQIFVDQITSAGATGPATGVTVTCSPTTVSIQTPRGSNTPQAGNALCSINAVTPGNYTATVLGSAGVDVHAVSFMITVTGSDFTMTPSTTAQSVSIGSSATLTVSYGALAGFNDKIGIGTPTIFNGNSTSPTVSAVCLSGCANPSDTQDLWLNSTIPSGTVQISIVAGAMTRNGTYSLQLSSTSQHSIKHSISVLLLAVSSTSPHDLAITLVKTSATSATVGTNVTITVQVQNLGTVGENSTVVAMVGDQTVDQKPISLAPGANVNVTLTWKTKDYSPGAYLVGGKVLAVTGETNTGNNLLRASTPVTLTSANTSPFQSALLAPVIALAAIIVAGVGIVFFYILPRRRLAAQQSPRTSLVSCFHGL